MLLPLCLLIACQLANHAEQCLVEVFHLSIALSMVGCGSAVLDAEGSTKFLHKGGCEVCPPIAQQIRGHSKNCYEALVKHLHKSWQSGPATPLRGHTPGNAVAVIELVLAYHDVFALEGNELGCTSAIEYEIHIKNSKPFKEPFRRIPPPLLEEVCASLRDMLEVEAICPSQSLWCNVVVLVRKKDGTLHFCVDFRRINARTKKDSYPLARIQEVLESMAGSAHFSSMDFK